MTIIYCLLSNPAIITSMVNDGLQKQPAFFELLKVIFCKIEDERNIPKPLEFYATSEERSNPDGQLTVKKRISKIFEQVKNKKKYNVNVRKLKLSKRIWKHRLLL